MEEIKKTNEQKLQEITAYYEKRIYDLEQLLDISKSFSSTLDGAQLLESIVFSCMAQMRVSTAGIFVLDFLNSNIFELKTSQSLLSELQHRFFRSDCNCFI